VDIDCPDDATALACAKRLADRRAVELWERSRFIARVDGNTSPPLRRPEGEMAFVEAMGAYYRAGDEAARPQLDSSTRDESTPAQA
jgi:hypothetical protein